MRNREIFSADIVGRDCSIWGLSLSKTPPPPPPLPRQNRKQARSNSVHKKATCETVRPVI